MEKELKEKVILITGASRGLGKELCKYFSRQKLKVIGIARSKERLKKIKTDIESSGGVFDYYPLDVTDYNGIETTISDISKKYGSIDILINNAGVGKLTALENLSQEDIDSQIDINLKGTIYFTRFVAPVMMQAKSGHIINISSTSGTRGLKSNAIYSASKHGINGFADSISKYLIDHNIHVTTLYPGGINTPWWDSDEWNWQHGRDNMIQPEDIAKLIEFILKGNSKVLFKNALFFPTCETNDW